MSTILQQADAILGDLREPLRELLTAASEGRLTGDELLSGAQRLATDLQRSAVTAGSERAAAMEAAPACCGCGRSMVRQDRQSRPLVTRGGEVLYVVQRWRCRVCRKHASPSWSALGVRHQCHPAVRDAVVTLCAWLPFEVAERVLGGLGPGVSDNTLQRVTKEVGGERVAARAAEAAAVMGLERTLGSGRAPARLYVMVDGFKARLKSGWREPRVGVVFETRAEGADEDGKPPPAERVSVVSQLADADGFLPWLTAETQRRGILQAREVVLVADGAAWIWDRLRSLVPLGVKVVEILDWYHATENLAKAVRAVWGEVGNEVEFERLKRWLWVGRTGDVLARLGELAEQVAGEAAREVRNVQAYFRGHRKRLNYRARQWAGYHVGSGQVESACKRLGKRVKGGGMTWTERGLNAVLCLLADELTDPAVRRPAAA